MSLSIIQLKNNDSWFQQQNDDTHARSTTRYDEIDSKINNYKKKKNLYKNRDFIIIYLLYLYIIQNWQEMKICTAYTIYITETIFTRVFRTALERKKIPSAVLSPSGILFTYIRARNISILAFYRYKTVN